MKATVILLPLLGLTWGLGVLVVHPDMRVVAYLFLICNVFQVRMYVCVRVCIAPVSVCVCVCVWVGGWVGDLVDEWGMGRWGIGIHPCMHVCTYYTYVCVLDVCACVVDACVCVPRGGCVCV